MSTAGQGIEVEGKTLKEAIEKACELLGAGRKEIEYKLDAEHFRGGAETVKICAWRKVSAQAPESNKEVPVDARQLVGGILERMGIKATVDVETSEEQIRVAIVAQEAPALTGRNGAQTMDALQHIVSKALIKDKTERRVLVELENFKERREVSLRQITQKICEKVLNERCVITLKPLNAYDRRLVHMEVSQFAGVSSRSIGEGQVKRLQIFPDRKAMEEAAEAP